MKTVVYGLLGALAAASFATGAIAQSNDSDSQLDFVAVDRDNSGGIDFAEAQVAVPSLQPDEFAAMDEDRNGFLNQGEWSHVDGYT